jgi:sporulation stage III transcriptional regulator spoIIID
MQKSNDYIRERVIAEANYIVEKQTTVRATARAYNVSKSTVYKDVTLQNGLRLGQVIPESIEIKKVFLADKNPVVKLGLIIK